MIKLTWSNKKTKSCSNRLWRLYKRNLRSKCSRLNVNSSKSRNKFWSKFELYWTMCLNLFVKTRLLRHLKLLFLSSNQLKMRNQRNSQRSQFKRSNPFPKFRKSQLNNLQNHNHSNHSLLNKTSKTKREGIVNQGKKRQTARNSSTTT